jgi:hypothetical protein
LVIAASLAIFGGLFAFVGIPSLSGGSKAGVAAAATTTQQIGMKVLLITDTSSEASYGDWENTLQREGVPFDTVVTGTSDVLPALSSTASNGTQVANYEGVILATSGTEGLTTAQWTTLQTFEHNFSVRQLTAYAFPSSDYGLNAPTVSAQMGPTTTPLSLTAAGNSVFPYLKSVSLDPSTCGTPPEPCQYGYEATAAAGANVDTLISGPNSSSMVGIYTSSDGRQTMYQTFDENQYELQSELLRHGELDWLARNTYFGDQRNYLETDVDDNFLSDDTWSVAGNATTTAHSTDYDAADALREVPADVTNAASWSAANKFRIDMLFNGGGSVDFAENCSEATGGDGGSGGTTGGTGCGTAGNDPLLAAFQADKNDFGWISHTWDHPNIDEGCATQAYIEAELNQNTNWAEAGTAGSNPTVDGLGLTETTGLTAPALGNDNPQVIVTGEHSGLANLVPGNPGQVDPPALDSAAVGTTVGTFGGTGAPAAGEYVYAVSDQFNTAAPGATPVAGTGESAASVSSPVTVAAGQSVDLSWSAVCHAADYKIYRAPDTAGTIGAYTQIGSVTADTSTDFTGSSTTSTTGEGAIEKTFTDTGIAGTAGTPLTEGTAVEGPYEQNPVLDTAFAATADGGIKYFGADASKPYPNPADGSFATGAPGSSYTGTEYPSGATFQDAGATGIPRYPTNIYYNVSTNAQEVDEYETLYDSPTCTPIANVTTCNPAGTPFTISQIMASVDQGMFQHMMGNDPRPDYFHQTNLMDQTTGGATSQGDGLFYEAVNPLLAEYNTYFAANAPIEQDTMPQIGALLSEQAAWAAADTTGVTGSITGNVVTLDNTTAAPVEVPLTGTNVGTAYAGTQSGWTSAPVGTSTETALAAWPAQPTTPVVVTPPTGPKPGTVVKMVSPPTKPATPGSEKAPIVYYAVQTTPKTVNIKHGKVTVSLKCVASRGKTAKGKICSGKFTLKVAGKTMTHKFRIKSTKIDRITLKLPTKAQTAARKAKHHKVQGKLTISTTQSHAKAKISRGTLTIRI